MNNTNILKLLAHIKMDIIRTMSEICVDTGDYDSDMQAQSELEGLQEAFDIVNKYYMEVKPDECNILDQLQ